MEGAILAEVGVQTWGELHAYVSKVDLWQQSRRAFSLVHRGWHAREEEV